MSAEIPIMFSLAVLSVGMWTVRVAVAARGRRLASSVVAATEAVVFALTFSHLVTDLGSPVRVISYAGGVAAGTVVGLFVNDRASRSKTEIQIMSPGNDTGLVDELRSRALPATVSMVRGPNGPVTMVWIVVPTTAVRAVQQLVDSASPAAFMTLRKLEGARSGPAAVSPTVDSLSQIV
ncbi:MAG: DUF5698 domain-containing protein [Acidimicrobiales bacterium]